MTQITAHFSLEELTHSDTADRFGLDNTPSPDALAALTRLAVTILEPIREQVGGPILVHDGYRSPEVNAAVGGVPDSQHAHGEAADISATPMTLRALFDLIRTSRVPYDQVILEETPTGGCVHVSCAHWTEPTPRRQALIRSAPPPPWHYEEVTP